MIFAILSNEPLFMPIFTEHEHFASFANFFVDTPYPAYLNWKPCPRLHVGKIPMLFIPLILIIPFNAGSREIGKLCHFLVLPLLFSHETKIQLSDKSFFKIFQHKISLFRENHRQIFAPLSSNRILIKYNKN